MHLKLNTGLNCSVVAIRFYDTFAEKISIKSLSE